MVRVQLLNWNERCKWSMRSLDVRAKLEGGGVEEIEGRSVLHSD